MSALSHENKPNQDTFVQEGAVSPLVRLLKSKDPRCQLKAACALQMLADENPFAQEEIDKCEAAKPLIRLLKLWAVNMKEQGTYEDVDPFKLQYWMSGCGLFRFSRVHRHP